MSARLLRIATTIGTLCLALGRCGAGGERRGRSRIVFGDRLGEPGRRSSRPRDRRSRSRIRGRRKRRRALSLEMPAGLTGYLNSVPLCSLADLATAECPPDSQVGLATTRAFHEGDAAFLFGTAPLYAVSPAGSGGYGRLAFTIPTLDFTQSLIAAIRTGSDYGMRLTAPRTCPGAAPLQRLGVDALGAPVRSRPRRGAVPAGLRRVSRGWRTRAATPNRPPPARRRIGARRVPADLRPAALARARAPDLPGPRTPGRRPRRRSPAPTGCGFVGFIPSVSVAGELELADADLPQRRFQASAGNRARSRPPPAPSRW